MSEALRATQPSLAEERRILERYAPWLRKVAAGMTSSMRAEELAQEGWIALWRAWRDYDGSAPLDYWLKFKATGRMTMLVSRDWATHKETQHVLIDFDFVEGLGEQVENDRLVEALTVELGAIELAYHEGEIYQALDRLTPREREYVYLRFWCGWKLPQMREHFGYEPNGLWTTSKRKLRAELAHLAA